MVYVFDFSSYGCTFPQFCLLAVIFVAGVVSLFVGVVAMLAWLFDTFCCHIVDRVVDALDGELHDYIDRALVEVEENRKGRKDKESGKKCSDCTDFL